MCAQAALVGRKVHRQHIAVELFGCFIARAIPRSEPALRQFIVTAAESA
jgi:hypothetical protein